jgi:hypothetical protein
MKFMGFEVKESPAVPPGMIFIGDKKEFDRLIAQAENDILDKLWATGIFTSIGRGYENDDAGLRTIENGAIVG